MSPDAPPRRLKVLNCSVAVVAASLILFGLTASSQARVVQAGKSPPALSVAPTGSDAAPCSESAPCLTLDHAYHVAAPGQVVSVACGTYPSQTLTRDPVKANAAKNVTIAAAAPRCANVGILRLGDPTGGVLGPRHLILRGLDATAFFVGADSSNTVLDGLHAGYFNIQGSQNVVVSNLDMGPCQATLELVCNGKISNLNPGSAGVPTRNITIETSTFHDVLSTDLSRFHIECLFIRGGTNIVIARNRFRNCEIYDVFVQPADAPIQNVLVENNWFAKPWRHGSECLAMSNRNATWTGWTIRFNTCADGSINVDDNGCNRSGVAFTNVVIAGNLGGLACRQASSGIVWDRNVWTNDIPPAGTDLVGKALDVLNAQDFDLHLRADAVAVARGSRAHEPSVDIDGDTRPLHSPPDAGADQRETALVVPGKSIGFISLGEQRADVRAFYGAPRRLRHARVRGVRAAVEIYRAHGGRIWAMYDDVGKVVAIGTTSPFYATKAGLGPGTKRLTAIRALPWLACKNARRAASGGNPTFYGVRGGLKGRVISSLTVMKKAYAGC